MPAPSNSGSGRKKLLLLTIVVLAVVLALQFSGLSLGELPTRATIDQEGKKLRTAQKQLRSLSKRNRSEDKQLAELKAMAAPLWQISGRVSEQEVREHLERLARDAQLTLPPIRTMKRTSLAGYDYIDEVELAITWTATMKEVTRLLHQIDTSDRVLRWTSCNIRPDKVREPKEVKLVGRLRALVLNTEAQTMLASEEEGQQ